MTECMEVFPAPELPISSIFFMVISLFVLGFVFEILTIFPTIIKSNICLELN